MTTATTFGAWVRQRRRALDLTQAELAGTIGYSTITVRRVESGERRPSRELIDSLAAGLRVPGDQLDAFRDLGRRLVGSAPPPTAGSRTTAAGRLQPPPPPAYAIARPRLTDRLDQAWAVPLTVVTAATGFGKSVAAAAWAEQHGAAWLTLGGADSPVESLAGALVDAVRLTVPSLDPGCLGPHALLVGPDGDAVVRAETAAARLLDGLARATPRPVALVLDRVESVEPGASGLLLIEALVRLGHPSLHLVLLTRGPLGFEVGRLRARGLLVELGPEQLRFTAGETAAVLAARLETTPPGLTDGVHKATEGWPAAVRLACEALADTPPDDRPAAVVRLAAHAADVFGLLATEVLDALTEPARQLVRYAAVLPEIDAELCRLLGLDDGAELIHRLAGRGVLRPRAAGSAWVLSDVVRTCVERTTPLPDPRRTEVLRCAARWFVGRDDAAAALDLLRGAGDAEACAELLDRHAGGLVTRGHAAGVAAVADLVPAGIRTPRAEAAIGQALVIVGRWDESLACLQRLAGAGPVAAPVAYWTGLIHHLRGDLEGALAAYARWRPGPGDDPSAASLVLSMRASTMWLLGQAATSRSVADEALRLARLGSDPAALAGAHTALAMIATGDGDRRANDVHDRLALEFAQAAGNALQEVRIRSNRGSHLVETAEYPLAIEELDVAVELAELTGFATYGALARCNRAEALAGLGRHDEAVSEYLAAAEAYDRLSSRLVMFPLLGLADVQRVRGELSQARAGYERVLRGCAAGGPAYVEVRARAGLARILAGSEPGRARALAEQALAAADGLVAVPARLAAGWVLLRRGERERAAELATDAADLAQTRRDGAGFAESRELAALAGDRPEQCLRWAGEASDEWARIGDRFGVLQARFVRAALAGDHPEAAEAWAGLRRAGLRDAVTGAAGALAAATELTAGPEPATVARVCLLGTVRVFAGDRELQQRPGRQAGTLLRQLAVHASVSRARLARELAPEAMPADTDADVTAAVAELRDLFDPAGALDEQHFIRTETDGVAFDRSHVAIDAEEFLAVAGPLLTDAGASLDALASAEARYTGELLEGERLGPETAALREECRAVRLAVLHRLMAGHAAAGTTDEALRHGLRLLRIDPYDERTHLSVVRALVGAHRHGEALRHYRHYTARMRELGIEPAGFPGRG